MSVNTAIDPSLFPIPASQPDPQPLPGLGVSGPLATLDYTSKQAYIDSLAGHYDRLTALLPAEKILTPVRNAFGRPGSKTRKGKVEYGTYLYDRKLLLRIESSKSERHIFYCTHCFDRPAGVEPVRGADNIPGRNFRETLQSRVVRLTKTLQVVGQSRRSAKRILACIST
jgi:hypothetical protein